MKKTSKLKISKTSKEIASLIFNYFCLYSDGFAAWLALIPLKRQREMQGVLEGIIHEVLKKKLDGLV